MTQQTLFSLPGLLPYHSGTEAGSLRTFPWKSQLALRCQPIVAALASWPATRSGPRRIWGCGWLRSRWFTAKVTSSSVSMRDGLQREEDQPWDLEKQTDR